MKIFFLVVGICCMMISVHCVKVQYEQCEAQQDCQLHYYCDGEVGDKHCYLKDLFPLNQSEFIGCILISFLIGLCQAGGIGGGPIMTPILLYFFKFVTKKAIQASFILIFFGSLGNFLKLSQGKTSLDFPLIWYDLALISLPMLMSGAIIGVSLNNLLPESIISITLVIVLFNSIKKTMLKYGQMVNKENIERQRAQQEGIIKYNEENDMKQNDILIPLNDLQSQNDPNNNNAHLSAYGCFSPQPQRHTHSLKLTDSFQLNNPQISFILKKEKIQLPVNKFQKMLVIVALFLLFGLLKGGKGRESLIGIELCGFWYWIMNAILIGLAVLFLQSLAIDLVEEETMKMKLGYNFEKYGEQLTMQKIKNTAKNSLIAGVLGGMLGLGGGVILTPLWLSIGILPQRAAATATFTVIFTSFISFFQQLLSGAYELNEITFFGFIAFCSSYIMTSILQRLIIIMKRESIIILALIFILIGAFVVMPILSFMNLIKHPEKIYEFSNLC